MTLVDANILVYTFHSSTPEHVAAKAWLEGELASTAQVALPWESTMAFLRLVTNARVYSKPASLDQAWQQVQRWLAHPSVWVPTATRQHAEIVSELLATPGLVANDIPDIQLAALAISHGLKLATHDQAFTRFAGLRTIDPLG